MEVIRVRLSFRVYLSRLFVLCVNMTHFLTPHFAPEPVDIVCVHFQEGHFQEKPQISEKPYWNPVFPA